MKKILFIIIAICLGFAACKKEHAKETNPNNQALHKVSYNVGFSQQTANFQFAGNTGISSTRSKTLAATGLAAQVDVILYAVFDSVGNQVHTVTQLSSDANFGSYTDNLHSGNYTIVVAAGKTGIEIGPPLYTTGVNSLSTDVISYGYYTTSEGYLFSNLFNKDAFYKKITVSVAGANSNQTITLDRITSEVTVDIQDAIPKGVKTLGFDLNGMGSVFKISTAQVVATNSVSDLYNIDTLANTDIGKTNYTLSSIFLYRGPVTVNLYASNLLPVPSVAFNITAEKIITSVVGQVNAQTILSGNLFGGNGTNGAGGGFTAQIDTSWNPTPITKTFP